MSLVNNSVLTTNSAGATSWSYPQLTSYQYTSTNQASTSSTSYVQLCAISVPVAGTYWVHFSGYCNCSTSGTQVNTSLYNGSTAVPSSVTICTPDTGNPGAQPTSTMAIMTMNGSTNIVLNWLSSSSSASVNMYVYRLYALRIA